jgi:simple sugar transport system substrate-binding protein
MLKMRKFTVLFICILVMLALITGFGIGCKATTTTVAETTAAVAETTAAVAETTAAVAETTAKPVAEKTFKFTLVVHSAEVSYWNPVKKGAEDAAKLYGCQVDFTGVKGIDQPGQVAIIESLVATGSDGIGTTITDPTAYNDVIAKAIAAGIPVVALNTQGAAENPAMAFCGFDFYLHGKIEAAEIIKLFGGKPGNIVLTDGEPGHAGVQARLKGARDVLTPLGFTIFELNTTTDLPSAVDAITNYYNSHKDVQGFFGSGAADTGAIGIAIGKLGLSGKIFGGGFDTTSETLDNIKKGYTQFTLDSNAYLQGYYPVQDLFLYKSLSFNCCNVDTGAFTVNSTNIDSFLEMSKLGYR